MWKKFLPSRPFEFSFEEDRLSQLYDQEIRLSNLVALFAGLAILIACLGLFGLAAFTTQQRTKEIGIRKVLGASLSGIIAILSRNFLTLVLISNMVAWPIAFYAMNRWLQSFAYRIDLSISTFFLSGLIALFIAVATVSYQAIKAARTNPIEAMRYE